MFIRLPLDKLLIVLLVWSGMAIPARSVVAQESTDRNRELEALRERTAKLEASAANLEATIAKEKAVVAQLTKSNEVLKAEVVQMRAKMVLLQGDRDKAFASLLQVTETMKAIQAENQLFETENKRLRALAEQAGVLPKESDAPKTDTKIAVPSTAVQGIVVEVQDGGSLVISIGSDDGLRAGSRLHVYRSLGDHGIYVAQIEVVQTKPDTATCKVVELQDKVRKGDRVITRL